MIGAPQFEGSTPAVQKRVWFHGFDVDVTAANREPVGGTGVGSVSGTGAGGPANLEVGQVLCYDPWAYAALVAGTTLPSATIGGVDYQMQARGPAGSATFPSGPSAGGLEAANMYLQTVAFGQDDAGVDNIKLPAGIVVGIGLNGEDRQKSIDDIIVEGGTWVDIVTCGGIMAYVDENVSDFDTAPEFENSMLQPGSLTGTLEDVAGDVDSVAKACARVIANFADHSAGSGVLIPVCFKGIC